MTFSHLLLISVTTLQGLSIFICMCVDPTVTQEVSPKNLNFANTPYFVAETVQNLQLRIRQHDPPGPDHQDMLSISNPI